MKNDFKVIKEPHKIRVGIEETKNKILDILKNNDMTIKEIADELNKAESTIYRHMKKLEEEDYVGVKEDQNGKNRYYRKTHTIYIDPQYMNFEEKLSIIINWHLNFELQDLEYMDKLGYKNKVSEDLLNDINKFLTELDGRIDKIIDPENLDIEKTDTMTLMRAKLLTYLFTIYNNDDLKEELENVFSRFDKEVEIDF